MKRASSHYYENMKRQVQRLAPNHGHGRLGTYPVGYQIDGGWMTNWPFYSNCVMPGGMVE